MHLGEFKAGSSKVLEDSPRAPTIINYSDNFGHPA